MMACAARTVVSCGRLIGASRFPSNRDTQISATRRQPGSFPSPGTLTASLAAAMEG